MAIYKAIIGLRKKVDGGETLNLRQPFNTRLAASRNFSYPLQPLVMVALVISGYLIGGFLLNSLQTYLPKIFHPREIPLTQGRVALVDPENFEELSKFKWHAIKKRSGRKVVYYAARGAWTGKRVVIIYMHRFILGNNSPFTDHADGNTLNNQKYNIRPCTRSENMANQRLSKIGKTSIFKGVSWCPSENRWRSCIRKNNKLKIIGRFTDEEQAAIAYDHVAIVEFGEFASPNFG